MGKVRLDFDGDRSAREIRAELHRRLRRAALVIWNHWKELLSVEGTGIGPGGKLLYGANPSPPGSPPHKQTGRLLASTAFEVIGLTARIGSNLIYFKILELGGARIKARPSLRRAAKEKAAEVREILSRPMS